MGKKEVRDRIRAREETEIKKQIVTELVSIIGDEPWTRQRGAMILFKKLKDINKLFDYEQVLQFLKDNRERLKYNMSQIESIRVFGQVLYVSKAIQNYINSIGED